MGLTTRWRKSRWANSQPKRRKTHLMKSASSPQSNMKPSSVTKKHSSRTHPHVCVWWWTLLMILICTRKFSKCKKLIRLLKKKRFGRFSFKQFVLCKSFTHAKFFIEIWNLQMFSYPDRAMLNLAILMFLKWLKRDFYTLRLAHLITPRLRSGKINPTIVRVIFGRWAVSYMRCVHWSHHSGLRIWTVFIKEFWKANTLQLELFTPKHWQTSYRKCSR